jgi:hypothetical protein
MNELAKASFIGKWKSFKTFRKTGEVKQHSPQVYLEFVFEEADELTILHVKNGATNRIADKMAWAVTFKDKRHYIECKHLDLLYEVITVNHTALVLQDTATNDKHFFTRSENWEHFIKTAPAFNL